MTANNPDKSEAARQKRTCKSGSQAGSQPRLARPARWCRAVPGSAGKAGRRPDPAGQTELKNGLSGPGLTGAACLLLGRTDLPALHYCLPGLQRDIRIAGYLDISRYSQSNTLSLPFLFVDKSAMAAVGWERS